MQFEQCEIRANNDPGLLSSPNWELVAEAVGPYGTYRAARTPRFSPYDQHNGFTLTLFVHRYSLYELDDISYHREFLNALVEHLVHVGWEPLAESGVYWFSRKFRRRVSLYVPDPEPATPYTLGDMEESRQKALKANDQYERRRDAKSCRRLAEAYEQLGLALEREHEFKYAYTAYFQAGQKFEEIAATAEAAKAYLRAEQVLRRK